MPAVPGTRWRRFVRWAPVPCGVAGWTAFAAHTSLWRAVLVNLIPLVCVLIGYGARAALDMNGRSSGRELVRAIGAGVVFFWTCVGLICLFAWSLWTLAGLVAAGGGVLVFRAIRKRRRKRATWEVVDMMAWPNTYRMLAVKRASDEELCLLWRLTGDKLRAARLPSTLEWIAEIRQLALDELAERDPEGFQRWIHGQPLTTDPRAYIRR